MTKRFFFQCDARNFDITLTKVSDSKKDFRYQVAFSAELLIFETLSFIEHCSPAFKNYLQCLKCRLFLSTVEGKSFFLKRFKIFFAILLVFRLA